MDLLADAVVWFDQDDEQMADPACKWLTDLDGYFTTTWGLEIDVDTWTPKVNRQFDAVTEQQEWEEAAAVARASGVYQVLAGMKNVPAPVLEAVAVWRDDGTTPKPAGRYVAGEPERYAQLQRALAAAGLNPRLRAGVEFLVDYARGDLSKTDLAQTPILVNPAEEVRGRVAGMLEHFATNPQHAKIIGQEIAVMTEEDQAQVRAAGKRIAAGEKVDPQLWPGWINRDELTDRIRDFARDAREVAYYAQALATGEAEGIDDDIQVQIDDMRDDRAAINAMLGAQGLHPIEKAHLQAVMADISVGRIDDRTLPEVLLIDERSKQDVDDTRQMRAAGTLAADVVTEATQLLERDRGQAMNPKSKVGKRLDRIGGNLRDVAQGHNSADQLRQYRTSYDENMGELGKALAQAGVEVPIRMRVRSVLDTGARRAGQHGRDRDQRDTLWANRIRSGAVTASREADAATHRAAVAAGQAMPPERACANGPPRRLTRPPRRARRPRRTSASW
ncbi:hypothetical protein [Nocardia sp. IFM 10818]